MRERPIDSLVRSCARCVKCGAAMGECTCWLTLRCPKCRKEISTERQDYDYPEAVRMEIICPKCDDGDFHEPFYFDANGKHITRDPEGSHP